MSPLEEGQPQRHQHRPALFQASERKIIRSLSSNAQSHPPPNKYLQHAPLDSIALVGCPQQPSVSHKEMQTKRAHQNTKTNQTHR